MSTQTDTVRYELMVIVSPDIGETAIKKRLDAIRKSIADFGGEIFFEDLWGLRDFAYSIRKHDQGYYAVLDMNIDPSKLMELERILRLEPEVLRHLIIKLPAVYQPKTLADMEAEAAEDLKKLEAEREESRMKKPHAYRSAPVSRPEVKEEKAAPKAPKKVEVAEEAPKKTAKKKEEGKKDLTDIDAKLDSILSNPDINF